MRKSKNGRKAIRYVRKYGTYSLYLAWAPFVGDPITIAAGIFRINFLKFSIIVYSFRIVGYIIVAAFFV
jgi:membrane protein YqaA with SNARE-associated domain